jgi:hypothetical protein
LALTAWCRHRRPLNGPINPRVLRIFFGSSPEACSRSPVGGSPEARRMRKGISAERFEIPLAAWGNPPAPAFPGGKSLLPGVETQSKGRVWVDYTDQFSLDWIRWRAALLLASISSVQRHQPADPGIPPMPWHWGHWPVWKYRLSGSIWTVGVLQHSSSLQRSRTRCAFLRCRKG